MAISDDDLGACFSTDDFAVEAVFAVAGSNITVNGYFTDGSDATEMLGVRIEASQPSFMCRTSQVTTVTRGITATINAIAYRVERIVRTGTGVSVVYLKTP
jgi:hypothetical protein